MEDEYRFLTLDIKNLYVSIPIEQILHITEFFLKLSNTKNMLKQQILQSLQTILHQHYFQFNDGFYKPLTGVTMGLTAEIFLECYENLNINVSLETNTSFLHSLRWSHFDNVWWHQNHIWTYSGVHVSAHFVRIFNLNPPRKKILLIFWVFLSTRTQRNLTLTFTKNPPLQIPQFISPPITPWNKN